MEPYYQDSLITIYNADCRDILPSLRNVSAIITDPPYGLGFMNKEWDTFDKSQFGRRGLEGISDLKVKKSFNILPRYQSEGLYQFALEWAKLLLECCLPGAPLLSFGGTRTSHRLACAIEDAGWQIRDTIMWVYGSGFPKSLSIGKSLDKKRANDIEPIRTFLRDKIGETNRKELAEYCQVTIRQIDHWIKEGESQPQIPSLEQWNKLKTRYDIETRADINWGNLGIIVGELNNPITWYNGDRYRRIPFLPEAKLWEGYGTALKPSFEPVLLCSKPLTMGLLYGIIIEDVTNTLEGVLQCQHLLVSDAVSNFSAIRAKLEKVQVATVHESVKISALENIGDVKYVASLFTSQELAQIEPLEMRGDSVQPNVRANGKVELPQGNPTPAGEVVNILTGIRDIGISAIMGHMSGNTASLWRNISEEILKQKNIYTIETAINLITELRTLKSYLIQTTSTDTGNISPNYEPIILAMKPLDGTFANNALKHKVAGLNIDECRIEYQSSCDYDEYVKKRHSFDSQIGKIQTADNTNIPLMSSPYANRIETKGRFPANFILDGSQEVMELFPDRKGMSGGGSGRRDNSMFGVGGVSKPEHLRGDSGSAARFFYCAKASRSERDAGLEDMPLKDSPDYKMNKDYIGADGSLRTQNLPAKNNHPTVKPLALMTYLCKLIKMPEYNLILDPFCGSGTTLLACKKLGIPCIGIDSNEDYCEISKKRLSLMV